jgi:hypothetical protein
MARWRLLDGRGDVNRDRFWLATRFENVENESKRNRPFEWKLS